MIEPLNEDLLKASPDHVRSNVERENGCAAHAIIAIRETCDKSNKSQV